ncbi:capsid [uncultured virus]|uniref:Capsid n=1 Tax=uncultured virus TaxID=340016 RepID=A0A2K9LUZ3_9VIRU|nr:capsid [uncultured virus]
MVYSTFHRKRPFSAIAGAASYEYQAFKKAKAGYDLARGIKAAIKPAKQAYANRSAKPTLYRVPTTTKTKTIYHKKKLSRRAKYRIKKYKRTRAKLRKLLRAKVPINTVIEKQTALTTLQWLASGTDLTTQSVIGDNDAYGCWTPAQIKGIQDNLNLFVSAYRPAGIEYHYSTVSTGLSFYIAYMRHNLTMKNISGTAGLICDVYTCTAATNISDINFKTPKAAWNYLQSSMNDPITGPGNAVSINTKTATPFDCPNFGKYWKVNHVERLAFDILESKTISMKCNKGFMKTPDNLNDLYAIKHRTMYWLIVTHPTIQNNAWTTNQNLLETAASRTTHFKKYDFSSYYQNDNVGGIYRVGMTAPGGGV